jgi:hypothetical protein
MAGMNLFMIENPLTDFSLKRFSPSFFLTVAVGLIAQKSPAPAGATDKTVRLFSAAHAGA